MTSLLTTKLLCKVAPCSRLQPSVEICSWSLADRLRCLRTRRFCSYTQDGELSPRPSRKKQTVPTLQLLRRHDKYYFGPVIVINKTKKKSKAKINWDTVDYENFAHFGEKQYSVSRSCLFSLTPDESDSNVKPIPEKDLQTNLHTASNDELEHFFYVSQYDVCSEVMQDDLHIGDTESYINPSSSIEIIEDLNKDNILTIGDIEEQLNEAHGSIQDESLKYNNEPYPYSELPKNVKDTKSKAKKSESEANTFPLYNSSRVDAVKMDEGDILSLAYRRNPNVASVSRILSETMPIESRMALLRWEKNMIEAMGEAKFREYKEELFSEGKRLHSCIEGRLRIGAFSTDDPSEGLKGHLQSVGTVVEEVASSGGVWALESAVVHPQLSYAGIVDCVALYRNTPVVIEWKTSTKAKTSLSATYDNPLQLAAYAGAIAFDDNYTALRKSLSGLLVYSYASGKPADTYLLSPRQLEGYWQKWLGRLQEYKKAHKMF